MQKYTATLNTPINDVLLEIISFTLFMREYKASTQYNEHFQQPSLYPYIQKYNALKFSL
jgi:hypothetical protein